VRGKCVFLRADEGQALVTVALALTVLLGFGGLAVDMGVLRHEKRLQQTAADAAAIAGANELQFPSSGVVPAAKYASKVNNFEDGTCNPTPYCITVTVNGPPIGPMTGWHRSDPKYVEAVVTAIHPTYFMKIFGVTQATVAARAVATLVGEKGGPGCVYTLGPSPKYGIKANGTPTLQASSCGISDNGDFTANGQKVNVEAGSIGVAGTSTNNGGGTVSCALTTASCPAQQAPMANPLAYLSPPAAGGSLGKLNISSSQTVPCPGGSCTYDSISITGGTVDFEPGTYTINGKGGITINGNAVVCNSTNAGCGGMPGTANDGVTFYITNNGNVNIKGSATVQLSAPNSGTYAGILFYQDPNDTAAASLDGTSASYFQGSLYFPSAALNFGGTSSSFNNSQAKYTIIVAYDLTVGGTSKVYINADYSGLPGGTTIIKNAVLVE
jgi:hypothetical protein